MGIGLNTGEKRKKVKLSFHHSYKDATRKRKEGSIVGPSRFVLNKN